MAKNKRASCVTGDLHLLDDLDGQVDLEEDLGQEYLQWLCDRGTPHSFQRETHLYRQGDPASTVYILREGSVKATCTDRMGRETLLKIHGPGSIMGLSALRPRPVRDATGLALESCETVGIRRESFLEILSAEGQLGILLVQLLLKRQQQLHARVTEMTSHRVEQRLARVLLQLSTEVRLQIAPGATPEILITHEELAALVLSRRQYVTAILRSFVANGLIVNRRGQIVVTDAEGLRGIATG